MNTLQSQVILARTLEVQAVTQAAVEHADLLQRQAQSQAAVLAARAQGLVFDMDPTQKGRAIHQDADANQEIRQLRRNKKYAGPEKENSRSTLSPGLGRSIDMTV